MKEKEIVNPQQYHSPSSSSAYQPFKDPSLIIDNSSHPAVGLPLFVATEMEEEEEEEEENVNSRTALLQPRDKEKIDDSGFFVGEEELKQQAEEQRREEEEKEEERRRKKKNKVEIATTTSITYLVNGYSTMVGGEKVVVDMRDSVSFTAFVSEEKKTFDDRFKMGVKVCHYGCRGILNLLQIDDGKQYLVCLSPDSLIFGDGGILVFIRHPSFFTPSPDGIDHLDVKYVRYNAPEILAGDALCVNEQTSVFSIGMITCAVISKQIPFNGILTDEIVNQIIKGERPSLKVFEDNKSDFPKIIQRMWEGIPNHRISAENVIQETMQLVGMAKVVEEKVTTTTTSSASSSC
jgi:hypothetical protein